MKRLLILLAIMAPVLCMAQSNFPDYVSVLNKYYSLYHYESLLAERVEFARKKDGWFAQIVNISDNEVVSEQVFWSAHKGRYQVMEGFLRATDTPVHIKVNQHINNLSHYTFYDYNRNVYYGYKGWDVDIIKDFEGAAALSDTLLESLARAYMSRAAVLLGFNTRDAAFKDSALQQKLGPLELPGNHRLQKIVEYLKKASDSYAAIYARNKNYMTNTGNIALKCLHQDMMGYMMMMICNRPAEATTFLDRGRLTTADSLAASNLLNSIEPNGILFTYEDSDTYPLWFLQEKYNIRKDVAVIQPNLLLIPAYVLHLQRKNMVAITMQPAEYTKEPLDFAMYYKPQHVKEKYMPFREFVSGYNQLKKIAVTQTDSVQVYDAEHIFLRSADGDSLIHDLQRYVMVGDVILFDIIERNIQNRKIYFTTNKFRFAKSHLHKAGIAYRLDYKKAREQLSEAAAQAQAEYIRSKYVAPQLNNANAYQRYVNDHIELYWPLIEQAIIDKDKTSADDLIKACFSAFGNNMPCIEDIHKKLPLLFANGNSELARKLAEQYIQTTVKNAMDTRGIEYYDRYDAIENIQKVKAILDEHKVNSDASDKAIAHLLPK